MYFGFRREIQYLPKMSFPEFTHTAKPWILLRKTD